MLSSMMIGALGKTQEMLSALPQVQTRVSAQTPQPAQFLSPLQEEPNQGQGFWQRRFQLNNVKLSRSGLWQANLLRL